jgi:hypothetical protein
LNIVHISDEERKLIDCLNNDIDNLKIKRQLLINEIIENERKTDEKQDLCNRLMGLPVSI